ncbi:MAG: nucleotidyltransferase family protein [Pseudomonadota bacterium]
MTHRIDPTLTAPSTASHRPVSAMLLAAGRGERMRPLTDHTPKPLLTVQGKPLMQWHLEALARGGFDRVVVNTAWLGEQVSSKFSGVFSLRPPSDKANALSNSEQSTNTVHIQYSHEGRDFGGALETTGGIVRALPLLCPAQANGVFWVLAGDVFVPDFAFRQADVDRFVASGALAHLWLVPNPAHNPKGDFGLDVAPDSASGVGLALNPPADDPQPRYTYSTIGLYRAALFARPWCDIPAGNQQGVKAALVHQLRAGMARQKISAQLYTGRWTDVGTPDRLAQLNTSV